jgi:hypothetical protein
MAASRLNGHGYNDHWGDETSLWKQSGSRVSGSAGTGMAIVCEAVAELRS